MLIQQITPKYEKVKIENLSCFLSTNYIIKPFDSRVLNFSGRLSKRILKNKLLGRIPAFVALAFWLRPSNLKRISNENIHLISNTNVVLSPIGLVFHVCPANVDTMFIYSLMVSMLMGNKNILRVSNRLDDEYISLLFTILNEELDTEESNLFNNYINIVTYQHEEEINKIFAEKSHARLIWGGDNTAKIFKSIIGNPRCKDIVFADRISISVFNTNSFITESKDNQLKCVKDFYNDSFTFDQKGCSSPQSIMLYGNIIDNEKFINLFYNLLQEISDKEYDGDNASLTSLKFNQLIGDVIDDKITFFKNDSSTLYFVNSSSSQNLYHSCGGGYFYLSNLNELNDIMHFIDNKVQTISYFGLKQNEIEFIAHKTAGIGVDRIVPIGKALNFDYIWDGYNLCEELTSRKFIQ
jgi:hypothetical protein